MEYTPRHAELRKSDAKNRAFRTFVQGLAIDVAVAISLVIINVFVEAKTWGDVDWLILGFTLLKTILTTAASYIMRQYLDKPGEPTLPPDDPGPPAEPADPPKFPKGV